MSETLDALLGKKRKVQADRILELLERAYNAYGHPENTWVPLPMILNLGIASHTRRISDLRKQGHNIVCERQTVNGQVRTRYRLIKNGVTHSSQVVENSRNSA